MRRTRSARASTCTAPTPVVCPDWEEGQSASLRCGLAALAGADEVLVVLGDQPGLTAAAVDALLAAGGDEDAVRATYGGTPGHPVLLRRPLLARAGELRGDAGFRDLLRDARVRTVEVGHLAAPEDVDAPGDLAFDDDFDGPDLDLEVWVPHYLPQWSSRAESAATYEVAGSELRLTIPPEQGIWCAGDHEPPLRVSGVQSGVFSGEVGSTVGQQPFRDGQVVREAQPTQWGWTPEYGRLEVRARMDLSPRSMASVWMVGLEEVPDALRRDLRVRDLRRRARARQRGRRERHQAHPRPGAHVGVRRAPPGDRRRRAPRLRRRVAAPAGWTSSSTTSTSRPSTRRRTTRCR